MINHGKRIAIFLPSLEGGGAEHVMANLAQGFLDLGNQVDLVLVKAKGVYLVSLDPAVNVVDLASRSTALSLPKLHKYLKKQKPNLLISTMNVPNVIALTAKLFHRGDTRFLIREANTVSLHLGTKSLKLRVLRWLTKHLYPSADVVVAVSGGVAHDLNSFCRFDASQVKVIHNPVLIPEAFPEIPDDYIRKWLFDKTTPIILGVGRLEKQKNFELLISAFAKVKDQVDSRLLILGEGSRREALKALIRQLGLESHVALPGYRDHPHAYMIHADLFVLSSLWEGFPNSLVEALACGCPVISTECPSGPAEILGDGTYGVLVPTDNAEAMARAIIAALSSPRDRQKLITRARDFSLDKAALQYLQA